MNIKGKGMAELQQAHCVGDAASRLCRPEEPSGAVGVAIKVTKGNRYYYRHREEILASRREKRMEDEDFKRRYEERERRKSEKEQKDREREERRELKRRITEGLPPVRPNLENIKT